MEEQIEAVADGIQDAKQSPLARLRRKITALTENRLIALFLVVYALSIQTFFVFSLWKAWLSLILSNCLLFVLLYIVLFLPIQRHAICYTVVSAFQFFLYYLNLYVYSSRGTPIQFSDVYCISDALNVAGNYPLVFSAEVLWVLLGIVLLNALIWFAVVPVRHKRFSDRVKSGILLPLLFAAVSVIHLSTSIKSVYLPPFNLNEYTAEIGLPLAILSEYRYGRVQPPEGYTRERAESILARLDESSDRLSEPVNIIVIMNESLADFSLLGETDFSEDPMPYYHSLEENCAKGSLLVSVYGGYTCNTEFEFLTGASMAFLPSGSLPYNQYMNDGIGSICKDEALNEYVKTAIHPYFASEWRRNANYALLGFDDFISGERFSEKYVKGEYEDISYMGLEFADFGSDLEYVRKFIGDRECYRKILEVLDAGSASGTPSFIFAVTIQNHGGYEEEGFESVKYTDNDVLNQYLTLTSLSDSALEYLLTELSEREEKTVVVLFGDHQPALGESDRIEHYITPYLMWANYELEWDVPEQISPNYLSLSLKQNVGIPLTGWDRVRLRAAEDYSAVSTEWAVPASGGDPVSTSDVMETEAFSDYRYAQYRMMFDH